MRKLPGLIKYANIVLKWGLSDDKELREWRQEAMDDKVTPKNGAIIRLDDAGEEKRRCNFTAGWPAISKGPSFNATGNKAAFETPEIVHEGLKEA